MLRVNQLSGFGASQAPEVFDVSFLTRTEDTTDLTNYSFPSQPFGADSQTRRIVACVNWTGNGAARTISSATIGGVTATIHIDQSGTSATLGCGIISAIVPAGSSGTIAINMSGACLRMVIGTYRVVAETSSTPFATANDPSPGPALSTTINIPDTGAVFVCCIFGNSGAGGTIAFVGAAELYDSAFADNSSTIAGGAMSFPLSAETGRTISATISGTTVLVGCLVAMSWH